MKVRPILVVFKNIIENVFLYICETPLNRTNAIPTFGPFMKPTLLTFLFFVTTVSCLQGQSLSSMQPLLDTGYFARKSLEPIKIDGLLTLP
jgi:hypothetical protein